MLFLTPGVVFLSRGFISFLFPCGIIAVVRYILDAHFGIFISFPYLALVAVVFVPIALVVRYWYRQLYTRRRAAALGARLVPKLPGKIGNVDKLMQLLRSMKHGYCGKSLHRTVIITSLSTRQAIFRRSGGFSTVPPSI